MSRPAAAPHAGASAAPHAPHAVERVGQAEREESLGLPHLPHMPRAISAIGGEKHAPEEKTKSLAALAARWEARTAARQAERAAAPEPVEVPPPPAPPPPEARDGWGLTEAERAAALTRLEGAAAVLAAAPPPAPPEPLPTPPRSVVVRADGSLVRLAGIIAAAQAAGAEREPDEAGFVVLVRPDGSRLVVTPGAAAELAAAGLLPALPEPMARSRFAATARPACWSEPEDVPTEGDRCRCGGRRWWTAAPEPDGWACVTCHPPAHLAPEAVRFLTT